MSQEYWKCAGYDRILHSKTCKQKSVSLLRPEVKDGKKHFRAVHYDVLGQDIDDISKLKMDENGKILHVPDGIAIRSPAPKLTKSADVPRKGSV